MADKRISGLTELAETPATGDLLVITDVSASTEDKKITWDTLRIGAAAYIASLIQTLTNKTINLANNTLTGTTAEFNTALSDGNFATQAGSETLTNKTLTSPVINTPAGIVKGDVGLGNVDNTSDATKNAAVATLTNKTLTSPVINTPTGIVKGDVGLGNVDNTSDANKPVSTATQTALDLKAARTAVQDGSIVYAEDAGATDAYAITLSPAPGAYTTGMVVHFKANTANTGACTLNVNGLGAKTIKKHKDTDLADNDIKAAQRVTVIYDGATFQMQSQLGNAPAAGGGAWTLKGYTTATAATTVTTAALDLDTDLHYRIIVEAEQGATTGVFGIKFNADTAVTMFIARYGRSSAAAISASDSGVGPLTISNANCEAHYYVIDIMRRPTATEYVVFQGQGSGHNGGGDATVYAQNFAGNVSISANITGMTFNGASSNWKCWVLKPATS